MVSDKVAASPTGFRNISKEELSSRAARARGWLACCTMCERRCRADRTAGERAPCGLGERSYSFKRHTSFAEEAELLPSYMVYFAGCNFRCAFCVQAPTCFDPRGGSLVDSAALSEECERMVRRGVRTINLLGGEPSLHLHTILEMTAAAPRPLPLVLNSNFYMTPEVFELLEGVVELYLADFKFGCDSCARRIAGIERYREVVERNLLIAAEQGRHSGSRLMVRHLLMPGHIDCCYRPVAEWMARHLPETPFHVMNSYVPAWRANRMGDLGRCLSDAERSDAERVPLTLRGEERVVVT